MDLNAPESPHGDWLHAGENLKRRKSSGVYYGFAKRHGKQKSVSFKTTDKAAAKRMLKDWLSELDRLASAEAAQITFEELAARWLEAERHTLKESSARRRAGCIKSVAPAFSGLQIRNITARHCESWAVTRSKEAAAATFAKELETMRGAFRHPRAGHLWRNPVLWRIAHRQALRNFAPPFPTLDGQNGGTDIPGVKS